MGIATYLISISKTDTTQQEPSDAEYCTKKQAYQNYGIQLFFNFLWSPVFFGLGDYFAALVILALLWYFVYQTMICYYSINKAAGLLLLHHTATHTCVNIYPHARLYVNNAHTHIAYNIDLTVHHKLRCQSTSSAYG